MCKRKNWLFSTVTVKGGKKLTLLWGGMKWNTLRKMGNLCFFNNVQNLCQSIECITHRQWIIYSMCERNKNRFRHKKEVKTLQCRWRSIKEAFFCPHTHTQGGAAGEHESWCSGTKTLGSVDPMTPPLSLREWGHLIKMTFPRRKEWRGVCVTAADCRSSDSRGKKEEDGGTGRRENKVQWKGCD